MTKIMREYTLQGASLYRERRGDLIATGIALLSLEPDWTAVVSRVALRTCCQLDDELEALLTGALPSELEG